MNRGRNAQQHVDVTSLLATVPNAVSGVTEADLNGLPCVLYTLGPGALRYNVDLPGFLAAIREKLESKCGIFYNGGRDVPLLRPPPVFSLARCFVGGTNAFARVVFDVDTTQEGGLVCNPGQLRDAFVVWLNQNVAGVDWSTAACWIFGGQFPDKAQSFHVYFPDYTWKQEASNLYKNISFESLNLALAPFFLKLDASITSSGIKLFCSDKWLHKEKKWRGLAQALVAAWDSDGDPIDVDLVTFEDLFNNCIPVVEARLHEVSGTVTHGGNEQERPSKRHAPAQQQQVITVAAGNSPWEKVCELVPEWKGCVFKTVHSSGKPTVLVPQSTYCPFKTEPTDVPAHQHATAGKVYAVLHVNGAAKVACHVCADKTMVIAAPPVVPGKEIERELHEMFSSHYARGPPGQIIQFGSREPFKPCALLSYKAFEEHNKRNGESVGKISFPKYWTQMPDIPSFPNGFGFFPDNVVPIGFYNTYTGLDSRIEIVAQEFEKVSLPELLELAPNWVKMVRTNICDNCNVLFIYLMSWLAFCVQFPQLKPGVAIVLKGLPGCGKGQTLVPIRSIYGRHGVLTDDLESRFNSMFAEAVFLQVQELRKGTQAVNNLKQLVTEATMRVEGKGANAREARVCQHVAITTNDDDAVHMQNGERRFAIFPCDNRLPKDFNFWAAVDKEVQDTRVLGALLSYWQRVDLTGFQPRDIPNSPGAFESHYGTMSIYEKFMYYVLRSGSLFPGGDFDLPDKDDDRGKIVELLAVTAQFRGRAPIALNDIGVKMFERSECVPKRLFIAYFDRLFPRQQGDAGAVPLWKLLHSWNGKQEKLFKIKKLKLPGNKRLDVVSWVGGLDVWRKTFIERRGLLDDSIWEAVGYAN